MGSSFPDQGLNFTPCSGSAVLTTGPPGKPPCEFPFCLSYVQELFLSQENVPYVAADLVFPWEEGFPGSSAGKESVIPGLGESAREGMGYPLQESGLESSMDRTVHGVTESDTTERPSPSWEEVSSGPSQLGILFTS